MEVTRWGRGGWVCFWGCGWVNEFLTSGIVYTLIITLCMNILCLTQFH